MNREKQKAVRRGRRKTGIRKRITGTPDQPRLTVYRSLNHMYAQIVDDMNQKTLVAASSAEKSLGLGATGNKEAAKAIGKAIAERAKEAGVTRVAFDRNGFLYHGRIAALAEGAREGGLEF